jgi:hypothetical protein
MFLSAAAPSEPFQLTRETMDNPNQNNQDQQQQGCQQQSGQNKPRPRWPAALIQVKGPANAGPFL